MTEAFSSPGWGVTYSSQGQECTVSACYLSSRALDDELSKMSRSAISVRNEKVVKLILIAFHKGK